MNTFRVASLALLTCSAGLAQSFDVASVKLAGFQGGGEEGMRQAKMHGTPSSVDIRNFTLRSCIAWAYNVKDFQISGPPWTSTQRFDIAAKASGPVGDAELRKMMRTLLADRFHLAFHRETRELPVYALLVGKSGSKLKPSEGEGESDIKPGKTGKLTISLQRTSMAQFAELISNPLQMPVVDMTGLPGAYDFTVDVSQYFPANGDRHEGEGGPKGNPSNATDALMLAVQEQLGLKLEARKTPTEMILIDRAEKVPTEN